MQVVRHLPLYLDNRYALAPGGTLPTSSSGTHHPNLLLHLHYTPSTLYLLYSVKPDPTGRTAATYSTTMAYMAQLKLDTCTHLGYSIYFQVNLQVGGECTNVSCLQVVSYLVA